MITRIYLKDCLSFEEVDLEFKKGLNIFTGPSGAGKSILMQAILSLFALTEVKANIGEVLLNDSKISDESYDLSYDDDIIIKSIKKDKVRYFLNNQSVSKKNLNDFSLKLIKHLNLKDTSEFDSFKLLDFLDKLTLQKKKEFKKIKEDFKNFLKEQLQLELSEEKTLITNAQKSAKFLSYEIRVRHSNLTKRDKTGKLVRNYTGRIVLEVSSDTIRKHLIDTGAMKLIYHNGKEIWKPKAIYRLKNCDDLEILDYYNSMIRGFYNYYCIANNSSIINSYKYIMEYSMYKTYGTKYRTSISKVIGKFRAGKDFAVKFRNSKGVEKMRVFYNEGFKRQKKAFQSNADLVPNTIKYFSSTKLIDRIKARECELCGKTNTPIEIHHVHRLKDLQGKTFWEALMIARNRKTIALCRECHKKLHCGQLN